jgi:hypothetical protein
MDEFFWSRDIFKGDKIAIEVRLRLMLVEVLNKTIHFTRVALSLAKDALVAVS